MAKSEAPKSDYTLFKALNLRGRERKALVIRIEELNTINSFSQQTFFRAVGIADQYLESISQQGKEAPCIEQLAVSCLIIAAKFGEIEPNFMKIVRSCNDNRLNQEVVSNLEFIILREIDFNLYQPTSLDYLEIYYRMIGMDTEVKETAERIKKTAFKMCRYVS